MAGLTQKQLKAIPALLSAPTIKQAAILAGIAERTLYRWLTEEDFKSELRRAEMEAISQATRRLIGSQEIAISRMIIVLNSNTARNTDRLKAARSLMELSTRLIESRDIEERLSALERISNVKQ